MKLGLNLKDFMCNKNNLRVKGTRVLLKIFLSILLVSNKCKLK